MTVKYSMLHFHTALNPAVDVWVKQETEDQSVEFSAVKGWFVRRGEVFVDRSALLQERDSADYLLLCERRELPSWNKSWRKPWGTRWPSYRWSTALLFSLHRAESISLKDHTLVSVCSLKLPLDPLFDLVTWPNARITTLPKPHKKTFTFPLSSIYLKKNNSAA